MFIRIKINDYSKNNAVQATAALNRFNNKSNRRFWKMADVDKLSDDPAQATSCLVSAEYYIHGPAPRLLVRQTGKPQIF